MRAYESKDSTNPAAGFVEQIGALQIRAPFQINSKPRLFVCHDKSFFTASYFLRENIYCYRQMSRYQCREHKNSIEFLRIAIATDPNLLLLL